MPDIGWEGIQRGASHRISANHGASLLPFALWWQIGELHKDGVLMACTIYLVYHRMVTVQAVLRVQMPTIHAGHRARRKNLLGCLMIGALLQSLHQSIHEPSRM